MSKLLEMRHKWVEDGLLCGHGYHPVWGGVVKAVDEIFGKPDKFFGDYSWVKRI